MWVVLYDSAGTVAGTGFSNENGYTFSGADGTAASGTRPLAVIANGAYVDAWYTCTSGCGGV
jgi:hypothetical protein